MSKFIKANIPATEPATHLQAPEDSVIYSYNCNKCGKDSLLQDDFVAGSQLQLGCIPFPEDDQFICPHCGCHHNLEELRQDLEIGLVETSNEPLLSRVISVGEVYAHDHHLIEKTSILE